MTRANTTVVNDNAVVCHKSGLRNERETAARRVAADHSRSDPHVDRVTTSVTDYATVWLNADGTHYTPPAGYQIVAVFPAPEGDGGVAVDLERVDA